MCAGLGEFIIAGRHSSNYVSTHVCQHASTHARMGASRQSCPSHSPTPLTRRGKLTPVIAVIYACAFLTDIVGRTPMPVVVGSASLRQRLACKICEQYWSSSLHSTRQATSSTSGMSRKSFGACASGECRFAATMHSFLPTVVNGCSWNGSQPFLVCFLHFCVVVLVWFWSGSDVFMLCLWHAHGMLTLRLHKQAYRLHT